MITFCLQAISWSFLMLQLKSIRDTSISLTNLENILKFSRTVIAERTCLAVGLVSLSSSLSSSSCLILRLEFQWSKQWCYQLLDAHGMYWLWYRNHFSWYGRINMVRGLWFHAPEFSIEGLDRVLFYLTIGWDSKLRKIFEILHYLMKIWVKNLQGTKISIGIWETFELWRFEL